MSNAKHPAFDSFEALALEEAAIRAELIDTHKRANASSMAKRITEPEGLWQLAKETQDLQLRTHRAIKTAETLAESAPPEALETTLQSLHASMYIAFMRHAKLAYQYVALESYPLLAIYRRDEPQSQDKEALLDFAAILESAYTAVQSAQDHAAAAARYHETPPREDSGGRHEILFTLESVEEALHRFSAILCNAIMELYGVGGKPEKAAEYQEKQAPHLAHLNEHAVRMVLDTRDTSEKNQPMDMPDRIGRRFNLFDDWANIGTTWGEEPDGPEAMESTEELETLMAIR